MMQTFQAKASDALLQPAREDKRDAYTVHTFRMIFSFFFFLEPKHIGSFRPLLGLSIICDLSSASEEKNKLMYGAEHRKSPFLCCTRR